MDDLYLRSTELLDFQALTIEALVTQRGWRELPPFERIGSTYAYVRDEIPLGYNESDRLTASRVLRDGYGQCNTKATLLMALLRSVGVECRLHGSTVHKRLQKGVVTGVFYALAPMRILHSWVEVRIEGRWVGLEGVVVDDAYLEGLRAAVAASPGRFEGYAVSTTNLASPPNRWNGEDTAIQASALLDDLGTFPDPDAFYAAHGVNLSGLRAWLYNRYVRQQMNANVSRIRCARCALSGAIARSQPASERASEALAQ